MGFYIYFEYFSKIEKPKFRGFYRVISYKEVIASVGATSMRDMGKVMGAAKKVIGSRADGGRINICVKGLLG